MWHIIFMKKHCKKPAKETVIPLLFIIAMAIGAVVWLLPETLAVRIFLDSLLMPLLSNVRLGFCMYPAMFLFFEKK